MPNELLLLTPVNDLFRHDISLADPTLLDPTLPASLLQGEWLVRDAAGKGVRIGVNSVRGAMQVFTAKGDTSAQAIGKITVLQLNDYEADTIVFKTGVTFAIGDALTVKQVVVDGVTRSALDLAITGDFVYGHVTLNPANNQGKLRFQKSVTQVPLP